MLFATLMLLLQASTPAAADIDEEGTITVTATRLSDLAAEVAACAATPCPTRRDAALSVAYASALFRQGQYREARGVLSAAYNRVKGDAAREPVAVSQVQSARATVAKHYGDSDVVRRATHSSYAILREHLGPIARPTLMAELRVAQLQLRLLRYVEAETQFTRLGEKATAAGQGILADVCTLYRAQLLARRGETGDGFRLLDAMAARDTQSPEGQAVQRAAFATAIRLANDLGDKRRARAYGEALIAAGPGEAPLLLASVPLPRPRDVVGWRWADIGYWIRPDGSVDDVEILRGTERQDWAAPLLRVIESRRFAPTSGSLGHYRVERYTMTADYPDSPGIPKLKRTLNLRYEMTPMTADDYIPS